MLKWIKRIFSKDETIRHESWPKNLHIKDFYEMKRDEFEADGIIHQRKLLVYYTGWYRLAYALCQKRKDESKWIVWGMGTLNTEILELMGEKDVWKLVTFNNEHTQHIKG